MTRTGLAKYARKPTDEAKMLLCDYCGEGYHMDCLDSSNLVRIPKGDWFCPRCACISFQVRGALLIVFINIMQAAWHLVQKKAPVGLMKFNRILAWDHFQPTWAQVLSPYPDYDRDVLHNSINKLTVQEWDDDSLAY